MNKSFKYIYYALLFFLSGCAVGPLVSHETARTVGKSNHELLGGYGNAGYVFKWNYGLSENLDFGLHWETLSFGVRAKYAFLNPKDHGLALAAAVGTGVSVGGSHNYGDLILSYMAGSWEPYAIYRFVHVTNDPVEFRNKDTGQVSMTISGSQYEYSQTILGMRFWFNKNWLMSLEVTSLFSLSSMMTVNSGVLGSLAFGYRF